MRTVYGSDDCVYIDHEGIVVERPKAVLYNIHGEEVWIPRSVIEDENEELVAVQKWWANKNGIRGDW